MTISDTEFDEIISSAMDELPQEYIAGLKNVAVVYADEPSPEQRKLLRLRCDESLFGLYEGTPITKRPAAESIFTANFMTMPDKITLFKKPILTHSDNLESFKAQVKHTLWHEIAHYYGLDHGRIHDIENGMV